jgi:indole-3-glycerol phosphate synthase
MGFLAEVVRETRESIARPSYLAGLRPRTSSNSRPGLKSALESAEATGALVVEFKRASPGADVPKLPTRSAADFVREVGRSGVSAYSCIATEPRFGGSPGDVAELVSRTDLPVLFKDFVVDPVQIEAADRAGARAILLIARLESEGLLTTPLAELARLAHARGLEVLLEFHERSELSQVANVAADVYGVNVRDLDTLRMEPDVAAATIRAAGPRRPLLGLSGVAGPADAGRFWELGVDGILVGSAVARAADPAGFVRSLHRPIQGGAE